MYLNWDLNNGRTFGPQMSHGLQMLGGTCPGVQQGSTPLSTAVFIYMSVEILERYFEGKMIALGQSSAN